MLLLPATIGRKRLLSRTWWSEMCFLLALQSLAFRQVSAFLPPPRWSSPRTLSQHFTASSSSQNNDNNLDSPMKDQESASVVEQENRHTVTWLTPAAATTNVADDNDQNNVQFNVYDGETLRTAALRRNVISPHNGRANLINCRGLGTCGTCAVEIVEGQVEPLERSSVEDLRLNFPPHGDNKKLRLACQIQVRGDLQVLKRTGFWGQHQDVAEPSAPEKYFGDFEYLLDSKSPEDPESDNEI